MRNILSRDIQEYAKCVQGKGKGKRTGNCKKLIASQPSVILSMFQNKDILHLQFIRMLYQWILEKYVYALKIPVKQDDLTITINNRPYIYIKNNHKSGGHGKRTSYTNILENIFSLLEIHEPLKEHIHNYFDFIGIEEKVDGRKKNRKRQLSSSDDLDDDDSDYDNYHYNNNKKQPRFN